MSIITKLPTSRQTQDATLGGLPVTGDTNTGHASTVTSSSSTNGVNDSDEKSIRWFGFENINGPKKSIKLKLSWLASGEVTATGDGEVGSAESSASFIIEYSLNGGSTWNTVTVSLINASAPDVPSNSFNNNNSGEISLPVSQDISLLQVRADYNTSALANGLGHSASSSVTVTVSNIQVELNLINQAAAVII